MPTYDAPTASIMLYVRCQLSEAIGNNMNLSATATSVEPQQQLLVEQQSPIVAVKAVGGGGKCSSLVL